MRLWWTVPAVQNVLAASVTVFRAKRKNWPSEASHVSCCLLTHVCVDNETFGVLFVSLFVLWVVLFPVG